jgi:hypothetical protein
MYCAYEDLAAMMPVSKTGAPNAGAKTADYAPYRRCTVIGETESDCTG